MLFLMLPIPEYYKCHIDWTFESFNSKCHLDVAVPDIFSNTHKKYNLDSLPWLLKHYSGGLENSWIPYCGSMKES